MTPQEALEIRKNPHFEDVDNEELSRCIDEALEKQIAKEPIATSDDVFEFGNCPNCNDEFNTELVFEYEITHCPDCGQALDWRDDN